MRRGHCIFHMHWVKRNGWECSLTHLFYKSKSALLKITQPVANRFVLQSMSLNSVLNLLMQIDFQNRICLHSVWLSELLMISRFLPPYQRLSLHLSLEVIINQSTVLSSCLAHCILSNYILSKLLIFKRIVFLSPHSLQNSIYMFIFCIFYYNSGQYTRATWCYLFL